MNNLMSPIEARQLAYFVMVCQRNGLNVCAQELGLAHSSLSAAIHKLERTLSLKLFTRNGSRLYPTESALWVFRGALQLLFLENAGRLAARSEVPVPLECLSLNIHIRFVGGRIARAICHAILRTQKEFPGLYIYPRFHDAAQIRSQWEPKQPMCGSLNMNYAADSKTKEVGHRWLMEDTFVLVSPAGIAAHSERPVTIKEMKSMNLAVPMLPQALLSQVAHYCRDHGLHVTHWSGDLLGTDAIQNNRCLLLPKTLTESRMMERPVHVRPLDKMLSVPLFANVTSPHPSAERFVSHLQAFLANPGPPVRFNPQITLRQFRYFDILQEASSMTVAAQRLCITQPALSMQIQGLERKLGGALFQRDRRSVVALSLTPRGHLIGLVSAWMVGHCEDMIRQLAQVALKQKGCVKIGVLPLTEQNTSLALSFSRAMASWRIQFPGMMLEIVEAPHQQLVDDARCHRLHLVLLETKCDWLQQLAVGQIEPLGIVANPTFDLLKEGGVSLEQLTRLPLIMPLSNSGLRSLLDEAAAEQGYRLIPVMESNSISINLSLVLESPYCTVLPASAIQSHLESGDLQFHPIEAPQLTRQLILAHSPERTLSEAERQLLKLLRLVLAAPSTTASKARGAPNLTVSINAIY